MYPFWGWIFLVLDSDLESVGSTLSRKDLENHGGVTFLSITSLDPARVLQAISAYLSSKGIRADRAPAGLDHLAICAAVIACETTDSQEEVSKLQSSATVQPGHPPKVTQHATDKSQFDKETVSNCGLSEVMPPTFKGSQDCAVKYANQQDQGAGMSVSHYIVVSPKHTSDQRIDSTSSQLPPHGMFPLSKPRPSTVGTPLRPRSPKVKQNNSDLSSRRRTVNSPVAVNGAEQSVRRVSHLNYSLSRQSSTRALRSPLVRRSPNSGSQRCLKARWSPFRLSPLRLTKSVVPGQTEHAQLSLVSRTSRRSRPSFCTGRGVYALTFGKLNLIAPGCDGIPLVRSEWIALSIQNRMFEDLQPFVYSNRNVVENAGAICESPDENVQESVLIQSLPCIQTAASGVAESPCFEASPAASLAINAPLVELVDHSEQGGTTKRRTRKISRPPK